MTDQSKVAGRMFVHSKTGNIYCGVAIGVHTETQEEFVVYHREDTPHEVWVRPLAMFFEKVEINGSLVPRFQYFEDVGVASNG